MKNILIFDIDGTNSIIVYDEKSCIIIDPVGDVNFWIKKINELKIPLKAIYVTHGHYDHIETVADLVEHFNVPWFMHEGDVQLSIIGVAFRPYKVPKNPNPINEGKINFTDTIKGEIFYTPGHSGGSCCFYFPEYNFIITGDTLFKGTIGATHFPFSNPKDMEESLVQIKNWKIPLDTVVIPGHGDITTFGDELERNPFLK